VEELVVLLVEILMVVQEAVEEVVQAVQELLIKDLTEEVEQTMLEAAAVVQVLLE
jgi:hypothetical protein